MTCIINSLEEFIGALMLLAASYNSECRKQLCEEALYAVHIQVIEFLVRCNFSFVV